MSRTKKKKKILLPVNICLQVTRMVLSITQSQDQLPEEFTETTGGVPPIKHFLIDKYYFIDSVFGRNWKYTVQENMPIEECDIVDVQGQNLHFKQFLPGSVYVIKTELPTETKKASKGRWFILFLNKLICYVGLENKLKTLNSKLKEVHCRLCVNALHICTLYRHFPQSRSKILILFFIDATKKNMPNMEVVPLISLDLVHWNTVDCKA